MDKQWLVEKTGFETRDVELHGSKFLLGNGYMGYRGTLEEYGAKELAAVNLAGLFDRNGDRWRESVNAPNPLYTVLAAGETVFSPLTAKTDDHRQTLNIRHGFHTRKTVFALGEGTVTVEAERFLSMEREHIMALRYTVSADRGGTFTLKTGIDQNVWDINGPHLKDGETALCEQTLCYTCRTVQNEVPLAVYEQVCGFPPEQTRESMRVATISLAAGESFTFTKIAGVYWGESVPGARQDFETAAAAGYDALKNEHIRAWEEIWNRCDVIIEGDEEAQLALRYSMYQLNIIAPKNTDRCGIPARGLSGQVYKGAAFWDTEMFMLPFFCFTNPAVAKNLVKYRVHTLEGAKRKAKEFGHEGAFFAWESQETGDDACTLFNVTDIFTGRPLRTYFKDKQIHISADMVYAMWNYCSVTQDYTVLRDGGLELIAECVWFYYTYSSFKKYQDRYELNDVVGPDEYHERVDNNAFTNCMVFHAAKTLIKAMEKVKELYPAVYQAFTEKRPMDWLYDFAEKLYVVQPNENGIIEQFDGYFKLEDVDVKTVRSRELKPNEYWGGHGLASTTRVLKQADVVMMLSVYRNEYSKEIKSANWAFYEPYTEHGSSLSACAYAIVAADIGDTDWAYPYFMKTACVDLSGDAKQYLGSLYIGGTHPAANGGSWNTAIFGFAGVSYTDDSLDISPRLPKKWRSLSFRLNWHGACLLIEITGDQVRITSDCPVETLPITVNGEKYHAKQ